MRRPYRRADKGHSLASDGRRTSLAATSSLQTPGGAYLSTLAIHLVTLLSAFVFDES